MDNVLQLSLLLHQPHQTEVEIMEVETTVPQLKPLLEPFQELQLNNQHMPHSKQEFVMA